MLSMLIQTTILIVLVLKLCQTTQAAAAVVVRQDAQQVIGGMTITTPPNPSATAECPKNNLFKREEAPITCPFGSCGTKCLTQGAFCCNPGGSLAPNPLWICDNGACITSVRANTGIVDCYDPDNPGGTTQSCIDNVATATCNPTDRCYTCSTDVPFCHWQTYIAPNEPTLRWFSCIAAKAADETFFATSVTQNLLTTSPPSTTNTTSLSTGVIIGIAVGGAAVLILIVVLLTCLCLKRSKSNRREESKVHEHRISGSTAPYYASGTPHIMSMQDIPPQEMPGGDHLPKGEYSANKSASHPVAELPGYMSPVPTHRNEYYAPSSLTQPSNTHTALAATGYYPTPDAYRRTSGLSPHQSPPLSSTNTPPLSTSSRHSQQQRFYSMPQHNVSQPDYGNGNGEQRRGSSVSGASQYGVSQVYYPPPDEPSPPLPNGGYPPYR